MVVVGTTGGNTILHKIVPSNVQGNVVCVVVVVDVVILDVEIQPLASVIVMIYSSLGIS